MYAMHKFEDGPAVLGSKTATVHAFHSSAHNYKLTKDLLVDNDEFNHLSKWLSRQNESAHIVGTRETHGTRITSIRVDPTPPGYINDIGIAERLVRELQLLRRHT